MQTRPITRRRALTLFAATAGLAASAVPVSGQPRYAWTGTALGADARIVIDGLDRAEAEAVIAVARDEIERLERVFSLYRRNSELVRLNADGAIDGASHDLRLLLDRSLAFWETTEGAFNPAIQPLWQLLATHFAERPHADGPPPERIAGTLRRCDPARIRRHGARIALAPGMALTFNGIAQGFITDAVADLFVEAGLTDVLIDLGEMRALPGRTWDIAIAGSPTQIVLRDRAVATSAGRGTPLSADGRWHHLIDPVTGTCPAGIASLTVTAPTATEADALSTALYVLPADARDRVIRRHPGARLVDRAMTDPAGRP